MIYLSDMERDALTELVNMGVGRAATRLSRMLSDQVVLSVPSVDILSAEEAAHLIGTGAENGLVAVGQRFAGAFSGRALLIFPEDRSLALVRGFLGDEASPHELADIEQDALAEVGNVILNGCLATIANVLGEKFEMMTPTVTKAEAAGILGGEGAGDATVVLFAYVNFIVLGGTMKGYIGFVMDTLSMEALKSVLSVFISRML